MILIEGRSDSILLGNNKFSSLSLLHAAGTVFAVLLALSAGQVQAQPLAQAAYTTGSVNLRQGPGPRYIKLMVLPRGAAVHINSCRANWCHINSRWGQGWLAAGYLRSVAAPRVQSHFGIHVQPYYRPHYGPRYPSHYGPVYPPMPDHYIHRPRRGYNPYDDGADVSLPFPQKWNPAWGVGPARPPIGHGVFPHR